MSQGTLDRLFFSDAINHLLGLKKRAVCTWLHLPATSHTKLRECAEMEGCVCAGRTELSHDLPNRGPSTHPSIRTTLTASALTVRPRSLSATTSPGNSSTSSTSSTSHDTSSHRQAKGPPCRVLEILRIRVVRLMISRNFEPHPLTLLKLRRQSTVSMAPRMRRRQMMCTVVPIRRGRVSPRTIRGICTVWANSRSSRYVAQESCGWDAKHPRLNG